MPITNWYCGGCKRTVPLDHFDQTDCGLTACPPDYIAAILADRAVQQQRKGVRVSAATGCPRSSAILNAEPVTVNPLDFNAALTGTAWHALLASGSVTPQACEVEVAGEIMGIRLVGHIDRIERIGGRLVICDHKHGNDFSRKYATLKPEYIVQISLYAELYAQQFGERPAGGVVWRHFTGSPPFIAFPFLLWTVERCLEHKPYNGSYTVGELLQQAANSADWREMPLAGASMNFGSKGFCDYCEVRAVCSEAATGCPF